MNDAFNEKLHDEGRTILRVSRELRGFMADAPADDDQARSLLNDCDTLDRVGHWLATTNEAILAPTGIDAAGPSIHVYAPDRTTSRCVVCGDGPWGRHRFQITGPVGSAVPISYIPTAGFMADTTPANAAAQQPKLTFVNFNTNGGNQEIR